MLARGIDHANEGLWLSFRLPRTHFSDSRSPPPPPAERRLLSCWISDARKHGLRSHQIVTWVRRKVGGDITVWRYQKNGVLGCAMPCVFCARELRRFDMRVHCSQGGGDWFSGHLDQPQGAGRGPPEARPTAGQIRSLFRPQRLNQHRQQKVVTRPPTVPVARPDWW